MIIQSPEHIRWLADTGQRIRTSDGDKIEVWEFRHEQDDVVLSAWAKHFRNHYCIDSEIDFYRRGYKFSRKEYLNNIKFPDPVSAPGPSIRSGDFSEVLVSDFLEFVLNYWVPRTRYGDKTIRNESTKGCDIMGFKILDDQKDSLEDTLALFEAKAQFSGKKAKQRLQDAVNDSAKDEIRMGESLNAIKQRLFEKQKVSEAIRIERFQNPEDRPFKQVNGAVALFSTSLFNVNVVSGTEIKLHPNVNNLKLIVIHGSDMMSLVHELYRRAADEA